MPEETLLKMYGIKVCQIVQYQLAPEDVDQFSPTSVLPGGRFPLLVVRVDERVGGFISGNVFLLNNQIRWVDRVPFGDEPGMWKWVE